MSNTFSRPAVLLLKLAGVAMVALMLGTLIVSRKILNPLLPGAPADQPIPFSHKHHVGDDGIDCRYCHTSVERTGFASMPSTHVCLSCHSQLFKESPMLAPLFEAERTGHPIAWTRVHKLPQFAYFDHSIHANKGIGCIECHGHIDQMPLVWRAHDLTMQWCLDCHENPAPHVRPPGKVFDMEWWRSVNAADYDSLLRSLDLQKKDRMISCSTCHR